jgi:hypothetical protein
MEKIGKIENGIIEREYFGQGFIYKDFKAFEKKSDDICYVPELSTNDNEEATIENTTTYNYNDFLELANSFLETNEESRNWCKKNNVSAEDIETELFHAVDWQHPETLLNEWEIQGSYTE